ncbi:aspartate/glutamate racemase family protein [Sphingosinicella sp. LHD-64]|uniref:aspartate/glutamate racemase family protein n=1 Tax=Sphingosinicella sp. LHD-64 TaxID=3072139 RepID=UPI00280EA009|nr:aspartate/glutamate racemase family protein [Sphingosinicella sp. LHD-64]MDQ8756629.1 aspartate/glutamate racemase family protein [Sphingosinicella sp. LHD-64]
MRKIGIVGGVSWRSTLDYYAGLCRLAEAMHVAQGGEGPAPIPEIGIESLDLAKAIALLAEGEIHGQWAPFDAYHRDALKRLEVLGVDLAVIASNTPHHRFDAIADGLGLNVINIFEIAARHAAAAGVDDLLLLGTGLVMTSAQIRTVFRRAGVNVYCPPKDELGPIARLLAALQQGDDRDGASELGNIVLRSFRKPHGRQPTVCLASTDLALAFRDRTRPVLRMLNGITYFDPTAAHIEAAFAAAVGAHESVH